MRRSYFLTMVLGVMALVYAYLAFRLLPESGWAPKLALASPFALVWTMPILWSLEKEPPAWVTLPLQWLAFLSMGWLSFAWVLTLARDVLWLAARAAPEAVRLVADRAFSPAGNGALMILAAAAVVYGAIRALSPPRLHEIEVPIQGLPKSLSGFRIAQLTDLHVGPAIGRRFVADVARRVNAARPDLVALTGDFGDGEPETLRSGIAPLAELKPRHGVYYVLGNHECYWNAEGWTKLMSSVGATVLLNEGRELEHGGARVHVGGVVDPAATPRVARGAETRRAAAARGGAAPICASCSRTSPGFSRKRKRRDFDLQLSGHTHGGQFFPWTLVARKVHPILVGLKKRGRCGFT